MRRILSTALATALTTAAALPSTAAEEGGSRRHGFDLQAHRGGMSLTTESTKEGFAKALEIGVTTLELDTQVTKDGKVVVTHDRQVQGTRCRDTKPVTPGDPAYPYVGKFITDLTLAQIQTMDCGHQQAPGYPYQEQIRGAKMIELRDVFDVVRSHRARGVRLNIETKVEAGAPEETAPRALFVRRVHKEVAESGMAKQVTIQSFDWAALREMHELAPDIPLTALTNHEFLQVGRPGASLWLGGIDADDYGGDVVRAADAIDGVTTVSPNYGFPEDGRVGEPGFRFYVDRAMVQRAHERGLEVVPWSVDDEATMHELVRAGVDGFITNDPLRGRRVMAAHGLALPKQYFVRDR